jgi:hypothetical protein
VIHDYSFGMQSSGRKNWANGHFREARLCDADFPIDGDTDRRCITAETPTSQLMEILTAELAYSHRRVYLNGLCVPQVFNSQRAGPWNDKPSSHTYMIYMHVYLNGLIVPQVF